MEEEPTFWMDEGEGGQMEKSACSKGKEKGEGSWGEEGVLWEGGWMIKKN